MSYLPVVTSYYLFQLFVSFQLIVSVHCVFPFVSPFPYYALLPSARFKSYILFVSSSLSFQLFPAVCSGLPSDLILPVSSQLFLSVRCVLSFISSLLFHLLLPFFRINSYVLFVSFFLPFQLFLSIRSVCAFVFLSFQFSSSICYFLSFVLTLMSCSFRFSFRFNFPFYSLRLRLRLSFVSILLFHLLLPFFRINSYVLIVQFFLPFQLFLSIRCVCAFVSTLLSCSFSSSFPFTLSISLRPSFRFNSSLLYVISFLSFQLSPHVPQKT